MNTEEWISAGKLEDARERAHRFLNVDPFPNIPRALLSKEHIVAYAQQAAMIYPAHGIDKADPLESDALKPASYETGPGNFLIHYDKNGKLRKEAFKRDRHGVIRLPANSISFVTTRDRFFLPNYIAMRFNLRIKHVHRGLLLGTGPLVDPGYDKEILIPIHNLTDSDYHISLEEGLIWVEFTKTSALCEGESFDLAPKDLLLEPNKMQLAAHTRKEIEEYLFKANSGHPIRSSIPKAILEAEASAEKAAKRVQVLQAVGILAIISIMIGLVSVFVSILSLVNGVDQRLHSLSDRVTALDGNRSE